ncbi:MAG: hypothetical protein JXR96_03235 [Deltaproteobacteria bacterium]|nr:hypothetical protein [Deltaproteobacteria bacterium]
MNMRSEALSLSVISSWLLALLAGCGSSGNECGPGTREQDGRCLPEISDCAPGTVLQDGSCVPACAQDEYWDGERCLAVPACASGTRFDSDSGQCEPACPSGQYWDGESCLDVPECAAGTRFDPDSGSCVPAEEVCAPGTRLEGGVCRPDATACGQGTHPEDGQCVPDSLPEPDVRESSQPDGLAIFDLPADGESIRLGGGVGLPQDLDDDGYLEADWDAFGFTAPAGAWLHIRAESESACMPGFVLYSLATDAEGYPRYIRYALNPRSVVTEREVYLPLAGDYVLLVSDFTQIQSLLFGSGAIPVGGDDFGYLVTVSALGSPDFEPLGLPADVSGELTGGSLRFFRIEDLSESDLLELRSLGQPVPDARSDLFCSLLLLDESGSLLGELSASSVQGDAAAVIALPESGDYLLVQDFLLSIGPDRAFGLQAGIKPVRDCSPGTCSQGDLAEGADEVWRFDLAAGSFFLFNIRLPGGATGRLKASLYDFGLREIGFKTAGGGENAFHAHYASQACWVYLWFEQFSTEAVGPFDVDIVSEVLPELAAGQEVRDLGVIDMPADTLDDAGLARMSGLSGQVAVASSLVTHGSWPDPVETFLDAGLRYLGPALDPGQAGLPALMPPLAWLLADGDLVYQASSPGQDLLGATWDLTLCVHQPSDLGSAAQPLDAPDQSLDATSGLAVFALSAPAGRSLSIQAAPDGPVLEPEIWLLGRGFHYQENWYFRADERELGLVAAEVAAGPGQAVSLDATSAYDGPHLVIVRNAGAGGSDETFDLSWSAD